MKISAIVLGDALILLTNVKMPQCFVCILTFMRRNIIFRLVEHEASFSNYNLITQYPHLDLYISIQNKIRIYNRERERLSCNVHCS